MHNKFIDKNRRNFNLRQMQVKNVLPEHFAQYYPKFITLLEKYYDWQNEQNATELINHLFASRDINETDISLLSYIEDELLLGESYFKGFGQNDAELRAAANFSNTLFRSKGTKFAIEWFFRSFYGVDAEVVYPKENVFKISEANSTIGPSSLRYLTDDKLYQTYSLLVRVGIPISKWKDVFKLFAHPAGMYLGGEVLLTDVKNIVTALPQGDSAVTHRTTVPAYTLSASSSSVNEGQSINFTIDGTNIVDNIDAVYYYIQHVTTSDSDFSAFYDSNNARYVAINDVGGNAQGTFAVTTLIDGLDTESTEEFKVFIRDRDGRLQDSATISLVNALSLFDLSVSGGLTHSEGSDITFVITGDSSNIDNISLQYYIDPVGANPITTADFVTTPPLVGSPQTITVVNDSARFTLQTLVEKTSIAEVDKTFRVILKNNSFVKDSSGTVVIENVIPAFNLSFANQIVTEGTSLAATLSIDDFSVGAVVNWSLLADIQADSRALQLTGSFIADSTSNTFYIPFATSADATVDGVPGLLTISPVGYTPSPYTSSAFTLIDLDPVYSIVATPSVAQEGESATFTFTGSNIPDGTTAYFYVDLNQTDVSDFVSLPPLTNNRTAITFNNNVGSPSIPLQFATNGDANETFIASLSSSSSGIADLATRNFTITDTQYVLTPSTTSVNEGNSVVFNLDPAPGIPTATYYYTLSGTNITASDFVSNSLTGSFPASSAGGTFSVSLANDANFEGVEAFLAEVSDTLGGATLASSGLITVNDTSTQTYSIIVNDTTEGSELTAQLSGVGKPGERIYFEITGDATTKLTTTQISAIINSSPLTISFGITVDNDAYEGAQFGTLTAARTNYAGSGGSTVATDTFNIVDAVATATLSASDTTPDEGDTVTFTISNSTNLPPTVYYSILNSVVPTKLSNSASSGQRFIPLLSTAGLQVGMKTNTSGINGTISYILAGGVEMSTNLTSTISSSTIVHFALPAIFDDFSTLPFGNTTIGSFNVGLALDDDVSDDVYTFVIRDAEYAGNNIATAQITIQDQTTGIVDINTTTSIVSALDYDLGIPATLSSILTFNSDGSIISNGSNIGTWITGPFNPSDYTVTAVIQSQSGAGDVVGSYGTALTLSSNRSFGVTAHSDYTPREKSTTVLFTVQGSGNNIDNQTFTISAIFFDVGYDIDIGGLF